MTRRRDPMTKKLLELSRDHRVLPLQGDKSFREAWPRKKRKVVRQVRHHEAVALRKVVDDLDALDEAVRTAHSKRKRRLAKHGVLTVSQGLTLRGNPRLRFSIPLSKNKEALAAAIPALRPRRRAAKG